MLGSSRCSDETLYHRNFCVASTKQGCIKNFLVLCFIHEMTGASMTLGDLEGNR